MPYLIYIFTAVLMFFILVPSKNTDLYTFVYKDRLDKSRTCFMREDNINYIAICKDGKFFYKKFNTKIFKIERGLYD